MILKSINKNLDKFGFPETLEYNNDKFHGHQKGVAIGVKDNKTNKFVENFLSKSLGDDSTRDFLLNDLVQDPEILLVEDNITFDKLWRILEKQGFKMNNDAIIDFCNFASSEYKIPKEYKCETFFWQRAICMKIS